MLYVAIKTQKIYKFETNERDCKIKRVLETQELFITLEEILLRCRRAARALQMRMSENQTNSVDFFNKKIHKFETNERNCKIKRVLEIQELFITLEEIRTPDLLVRSQTLYPTELRAHISYK